MPHSYARPPLRLPSLLAVLLMPAPLAAEPIVVDKVVAFVGTRPITLSEVELELRLGRAAAGDVAGALASVHPAELADLLPDLLARTAILRGMRSQYVDVLSPERVEADFARMRDAFPSREEWDRFLVRLELTEAEARERRRRVLEATAILDTAVQGAINVKSQLVEDFLAENPGIDRGEAERRVRAELEVLEREKLLERKQREMQARIVDPIVARGGD